MEYSLDNRKLSPPEPMMRTLAKLDELKAGDTLWIHNDRVPAFLLPELEERVCTYELFPQEDNTCKVRITKGD